VLSADGIPPAQRDENDPWEWWIYLLIALTVVLCLVVVIGAIVCAVNRKKNKSTAPPREMFRQNSASAHLETSSSTMEMSKPGTPRSDRVAIYSSMPEMPQSGSTLVGIRSEYADAESIRQLGHHQSNASIDYGVFCGAAEAPVVYDRGFH